MISGSQSPGSDEPRVVYPIYAAIFFGPFALLRDFTLARSRWMTLLEGMLFFTTILSLKLAAWNPRPALFALLAAFALCWYHGVRTIINGNAVAAVSLLFVAAAWALQHKRDDLAGIFLALTTIKPQLALIPGLFVLVWTLSNRRWRCAAYFFGSLAVLTLVGMAFAPTWILQNLAEIRLYATYQTPTTVGMALDTWLPGLGRPLGWLVTLALAGILLREWKNALGSDFNRFLWVFSLTLVASQWTVITTDPGNFIILTLPLILTLKHLNRLSPAWVIASLLLLLVGLWALFLLTLPPDGNQQNPVMFFPLPLFLLVGLYCFPDSKVSRLS
jgi:hypothetical protein